MVDTELLSEALRQRGHTVDGVIPVPHDAGEYEFIVDGETLSLAEARALLTAEQVESPRLVRKRAAVVP